jgi:hypothetical protein
MSENAEPKLAPPGAGLPKVELLVARWLFARRMRRGNRETFDAEFALERQRVRTLVQSCGLEVASRRVLIPRVRGLEDSSRYWSVWMTLEHLRIVHGGMVRTIESLANGVVPPGQASTAQVKPGADLSAAVVEAYEKSCDELVASAAGVADLNTTVRYAHPWFGPLNAAGWHALAPNHLAVHRQQIERILARL